MDVAQDCDITQNKNITLHHDESNENNHGTNTKMNEKSIENVKNIKRKISVPQLTEQYEIHTKEKKKSLTPRSPRYKNSSNKMKTNLGFSKNAMMSGAIKEYSAKHTPEVLEVQQVKRERKGSSRKRSASALKKVDTTTLFGNWMEVFDPVSGRNYYYNKETMTSTWEKPVQGFQNSTNNSYQNDGKLSTVTNNNSSTVFQPNVKKSPEEELIDKSWKVYFDQKTGRNYYYNTLTKENTWKKPLILKQQEEGLLQNKNETIKTEITKTEMVSQINNSVKVAPQITKSEPTIETKPVHKPIINFTQQGFKTLGGATTEEEEDEDEVDDEIVEIEGMDSASDEEGDEFISRPQGMSRNTEDMFKHLTPEALKALSPETLKMLPPEYQKLLTPKMETLQKPKPTSPTVQELRKKTDSYKELKKERGSFFKLKVKEEKNHSDRTKTFFGAKQRQTVIEHNKNNTSHGRFSPNNLPTTESKRSSYLDELSSFDVEKSDQIDLKRGSYDFGQNLNAINSPAGSNLNEDARKKRNISFFQTIAHALGPKERSHSTISKRTSTPYSDLTMTPSPVITPLSDEDDDIGHTDYNHFRCLDFDDYSYVKEDEPKWIIKEFDETEEEEEDFIPRNKKLEMVLEELEEGIGAREVVEGKERNLKIEEEVEEKIIIKNPLFETFIEILNPLYDEVFIYKNPLADELIEYINPLFDGEETNYFTDLKPEIELLLELQKSLKFEDKVAKKSDEFKLKTLYQCFYGHGLITWIHINSFPYFTYGDSIQFCQEMMDKLLFKNVFDIECTEFEGDEYYRFTDTWEFLVDKQMNVRIFDKKKEEIISNPFEHRIDSYIVIRNIDNLMKGLLGKHLDVNIYQKTVSKSVGYLVIWRSKYFTELRKQVHKLQKVNLLEFNENMRKSILINIYNLMVLHSLMKCKKPEKLEQRQYAFHNRYYIIGNFKLTIDSFEKEIFFDRERNHPLSIQFDPRIHFVLHNGSNSSPLLRYYSWDDWYLSEKDTRKTLEYQIKKSTKLYMRTEILINDKKKEIKLPHLFKTYDDHFGNSIDLQIKFISQFIQKSSRDEFLKKTKTYSIDYLSEDLKFNEK